MNASDSLLKLVAKLKREKVIASRLVEEAFLKIDRADFVPPEYRGEAYEDYPIPIGEGQTISQPYTVAFMLEKLDPQPGEKMLDVGTGSGWQAALLGHIVSQKEGGSVVSIERIQSLADSAKKNIEKYKLISRGAVKMVIGDGAKGYEPGAPYRGIIAAASGADIPQEWKDQLAIGGKIVAPVEHSIVVTEKISKDQFRTHEHFGFSFVPLIKG